MAFFDDLSKKITDASTKTIQKGKDLTDVARLNSQISAEENRINTLYGMIGKQYMELHRKDAEDAFAGLVASVAEAEQNIAACRAKITELRAVPHCPNCGAELVKGAAFCGICGTPIPVAPAPAPVTVPAPQQPAQAAPVVPAPAVPVEAPTTLVQSAPAAPAVKFCPNCGVKMPADAQFCAECGTRF